MPDTTNEVIIDSEINSPSFRAAELRSELIRVRALLAVFGSLLGLILIRGILSLAQGYRGEAWPFVTLLALATLYEVAWLRFARKAMDSGRTISVRTWAAGICVESLLPTAALVLQSHASFVSPDKGPTSPVVLAYFLLIILSTLHLNPALSRLSGGISAAGYAAASVYVFTRIPEVAAADKLFLYGAFFSCTALLFVGGYAAGAVANQIRRHVIAALHEAETKAKIAALEHDLGIARSIQQGLLPKSPPQIEGFDIAGWNQPADETGGDYFDWQALANGRLALTIADVTGHGIGPAIGMAACRAYARAGFIGGLDLRNLLAKLNVLLCDDLPDGKFVTLAAGVLDPARSTLQLVSAGHGPLVFYCSEEDRFVTYDAQGPPLGILPQIAHGGPHTLNFSRGDILVLITDGFIEWRNTEDDDFGQTRLEEVIRANRERSSAAIISELHTAVLKFGQGVRQADDLTALVVKRV